MAGQLPPTTGTSGSIKPLPAELFTAQGQPRGMKFYMVSDAELHEVASTTAKATFYWSFSFFWFGIAGACLLSLATLSDTSHLTTPQVGLFYVAPYSSIALGIGGIVGAIMEWRQRRSALEIIKRESGEVKV